MRSLFRYHQHFVAQSLHGHIVPTLSRLNNHAQFRVAGLEFHQEIEEHFAVKLVDLADEMLSCCDSFVPMSTR
jgi:hypothetical protein